MTTTITEGAELLDKMQFDGDSLPRIIEIIEQRFGSTTYNTTAKSYDEKRMLGKIARRRAIFYGLESEDPRQYLPEHLKNGPEYQSDRPRFAHSRLQARLDENEPLAKSHIKRETVDARKKMNDAESTFNNILKLVQEDSQIDLVAELATGLIRDCYGVLHWFRKADAYPEVEYEYLDELPQVSRAKDADNREAKATRDRYEKNPEYTEGNGSKRYREKSKALLERRKRDKACAGSPYGFDVVDPETFMYVPDRSSLNGYGMVLIRKEVGVLDYYYSADKHKDGRPELSLAEANDKILMGREAQAPADWMPSGLDWGAKATLYQLWTRDEFYEVLAGISEASTRGGGMWEIRQTAKHAWKMPPFAIAPGAITASSDPVLKYLPALEGVYKVLPTYNLMRTLFLVLAQQIALPEYVIERDPRVPQTLGEDGADVEMTRDSAEASVITGKLQKISFELNQAFIEAMRLMGEDIEQALPDWGDADISASTQPWAIRLQQAIKNVEPARYLKSIDNAIGIMIRSIAQDIALDVEEGGFGEGVYTFARIDGGSIDYDNLVGIEPEDIRTLDFYVETNATSAQEAITMQEHMRTMLNDPKTGVTSVEFAEKALNQPDGDEYMLNAYIESMKAQLVDGMSRAAVAARLNEFFIMGENGQWVNVGSVQPGMPEDVMAAAQQQQGRVPGNQVPQQTQMSGLPGLNVNGAMALPGVPG